MNNNYTVVWSSDPYLLARLSTDLMMEGMPKNEVFDRQHPFEQGMEYLMCYKEGHFNFHNHSGCFDGLRLTLTERNYSNVLTKIIERHGK